MMSSESRPALSAMMRGMTSSALAYMFITSCSLPAMLTACFLRPLESSISVAPPPATTALVLKHRLTIIMASLRDLSASLMNCSAPPRKIMVADLVLINKGVHWGIPQKDCIFLHQSVSPRIFRKFQAQ